ncbi:uncharacterized protein DUF1877 [Actinocrispum wychmicini]|uniref:Uncharacterized protein DUF1877 n=2 Tax=Actinocrispum wychmicini TaxID=1213861 RepID=A0A4V2S3G9_9PSEU|nr:uncharacterized protein DUF1877 [Actinocrispum wychmicini]
MAAREIYPAWRWTEDSAPEELAHLRDQYAMLRTFFNTVASNGNAALGHFCP